MTTISFTISKRKAHQLSSGDRVCVVDTPLTQIGMAICFDLCFPKLLRRLVKQGAGMFLVFPAWPYPRLAAWLMLNRVRALENQCYLVSSDSGGMNQATQFVGHSIMVDPWGTILAGGGDREITLQTGCERSEVAAVRVQFPSLAGRVKWLNTT